jgi:hypothetical protein
MPVASTDLIWYLSANRPEDDTSTSGGGLLAGAAQHRREDGWSDKEVDVAVQINAAAS